MDWLVLLPAIVAIGLALWARQVYLLLLAACDHVDYINTQMPYALLVAGVAFVGYIIAGFLV